MTNLLMKSLLNSSSRFSMKSLRKIRIMTLLVIAYHPLITQKKEADLHPTTSRVSDDKLDYWNVVPTEILEKILLLSVETAEKPPSTYYFLSRTCSRFNMVLQRQRHVLLPSVYIPFTDDEAKKLVSYNGKINVSIRKIIIVFGVACSAILKLSEIIGDKKWKSAWLVLERGKYSTYFVHRYFWKCSQKAATMPILIKDDDLVSNITAITTEVFWLSNEFVQSEK